MLKKILAALAAIGGFFSAIFYVLMKQAKDERKQMEKELEREKAAHESDKAIAQSIAQQEKENEKLVQESKAGDGINSFNAGLNRLQNAAEKGRKRNSGAGSSGN